MLAAIAVYLNKMPGTLYLIPNSLGNPDPQVFLPPKVMEVIPSLKVLIVENVRNARRFLKSVDAGVDIDSISFFELNKHTRTEDIFGFLEALRQGKDTGIISEAGVPGVADPGAEIVRIAHKLGAKVVPLTGPSSILLALMASGQNGQSFRFLGYLPVKSQARMHMLRQLESRAGKENETQIFIETPYRNMQLLTDILAVCKPDTMLSIAVDLTMDTEMITTLSVSDWKNKKPELHKRPAIFLLGK